MEQSTGKKERLILAACLLLGCAVAAWQYFSPAAGLLLRGRDVNVALLGERSSALLVYRVSAGTVNAFVVAHPRARKGVSLWQRACDLLPAAGSAADPGGSVFYVALSSAPDLEELWAPLEGWRADPRLLWRSARRLAALRSEGATNLSGFDLFALFSELAGLGKRDFVLTEVSRGAASREEEAAPSAPLVEVFNASGRAGLAAQVAKSLRAAGFDVITEGTLPQEKRTRIVGFSRDTAPALRLREALGLQELEIRVKTAQKSVAAAAVVLGQDFKAGKPGK